jgi:hypothetical protein
MKMEIIENPKLFKLNIDLKMITTIGEGLLQEFTNVFAWNYKELKGIPPHIIEHKIELDITLPPSH